MTIKISQLGNVAAIQGNVLLPIVSNITGTLTTVQANLDQLGTYILTNAGNVIPLASNTYSLGNSTTWWKDLWISNTTIYIGGVALATAGGKLTLGGANVGTSGLDTYTGNVSAGNLEVSDSSGNTTVTIDGTTGNISASAVDVSTVSLSTSIDMKWGSVTGVSVISGGSGYVQGEFYETIGGNGVGYQCAVISASGGNITFAGFGAPGVGYKMGDTVTVVGAGTGNNAVISINYVSMPVLSSGEYSWSFADTGATTFPGNTIIDSSGNISLSDAGGNTTITIDSISGDISAGNIDVYDVTTDTVSLGSTELYGSSGSVIFSETTVSTTVTGKYWAFNPYGITWFNVVDTTGVEVGMQIYWAGYLIGSVTGVTSGNVSCTPLTATPNFTNNSAVSFGNLASLATDTISSPTGNVSIEGNVSTGNISVTGNITVLQWLNAAPTGNINIGSPVRHNSNVTVLQWLNGSPTANLNISSGSGQPVNILSNAGAKAWTFNSNGSVTFPDNTLQTSGYPGQLYGNAQVDTYLPTYGGNVGPITVSGNLAVFGVVNAGFPSALAFPGVVVNATNDANSYVQLNIQNINTVGNLVSADFIATAPNGTDSSYYIDMGINGNNYSSSSWTVSGKNDGYVYINSGNLTLGTDTPGTTVKVHVGGTLAGNVVATFSNSNVTIGGNLIVSNTYVPTANNSVGSKGQISYDSSYVYVCIAANTWRRANLAIW